MFLTEPVSFEEGAAAVRKLGVVSAEVFRGLIPEIQGLAFTVSGLESLDAVKRVRDAIAELPEGQDFGDVVKKVAAELVWLNPEAAMRRAQLLVRMHGFRAYAAASFRQMEAQRDVFPYRQYVATMDSSTRAHHAALHGKVLPADHPFWANHTGPWEYGCRCEVVALTPEDVDVIQDEDKRKPPEDRRVLEGAFLAKLENEGLVMKTGGTGFFDVRTPRERNGEGFEWRAGEMNLPWQEIEKRYSPADWARWKARAEAMKIADGRTVWEWFTGGKAKGERLKAKAVPVPGVPAVEGPASLEPSAQVAAHLHLEKRMPAALKERFGKALGLSAQVHSDGGMELSFAKEATSGDYGGLYEWEVLPNGRINSTISLKQRGMEPLMTALHELGHKLDRECIATPGTAWRKEKVLNEAAAETRRRLVELLLETPALKRHAAILLDKEGQDYVRKDSEIFARAYAQYIAVRSGSVEALKELRMSLLYAEYQQWPEADFAAALPLMDQLLRELKFRKQLP